MLTIEEKQNILNNLAYQEIIIKIDFNNEIHNLVIKNIKNDYLKFFPILIFIEIFSLVVFIILLFFKLYGKMLYVRALALVFVFLPFLLIFEYFKKSNI